MQYIGHAIHEFDQTGPPVILRDSEYHTSGPSNTLYYSVFEQQNKPSPLFASIMLDIEEQEAALTLTNLDSLIDVMNHTHSTQGSIDQIKPFMPVLPSDCMQAQGKSMKTPRGPSKSTDSDARWSDEEWVSKNFSSAMSDGSNVSSDEDMMHGDSLLKGLVHACSREKKKMSKKPKRAREGLEGLESLESMENSLEPKKISKRPCQNAKEAGLSENRICTLYEDLRATAPTTLAEYTKIVSDHATMNVVLLSCIRNILTCKSRAEHSSKYWPDCIWELYRSEVRCAECRKLDVTSKILCPHNSKGRPFKVKDPAVGAKMVPLTDKTGKAKKLVREYKIHLDLHQVWQAYGCKKAIQSIDAEKSV